MALFVVYMKSWFTSTSITAAAYIGLDFYRSLLKFKSIHKRLSRESPYSGNKLQHTSQENLGILPGANTGGGGPQEEIRNAEKVGFEEHLLTVLLS